MKQLFARLAGAAIAAALGILLLTTTSVAANAAVRSTAQPAVRVVTHAHSISSAQQPGAPCATGLPAGTVCKYQCSGYIAPWGHYKICTNVIFGGAQHNKIIKVYIQLWLWDNGNQWGAWTVSGPIPGSNKAWGNSGGYRNYWSYAIEKYIYFGWIAVNRWQTHGSYVDAAFWSLDNSQWVRHRDAAVRVP